MKTFIISLLLSLVCGIAYAKPHCQGFNNYDNKVTIVFTDDKAGKPVRGNGRKTRYLRQKNTPPLL